MKRENFKQAEQTLHQINAAEKLLDEVKAMIPAGEATELALVSIEFREGSQQLYVPVHYSELAKKFLIQLRKHVETELSRLNYELSQL